MAMMERLFKFACQEAQEKEGGGEAGGEWKGDTLGISFWAIFIL